MHLRLDSPNYVTTRSNGQQSVQSRTRSSTRLNLEISFLFFKWVFFFEENSNDIFWPIFFWADQNVFPLPKKKNQMKQSSNEIF